MSVVGCSGEDFASILKALGFRRERRKLAQTDAPTQIVEPTNISGEPGAPALIAFDEIWRPGKRKDAREPRADHAKGGPRRRERQSRAPRQREPMPRLAWKERPRVPDGSPFAVLAELCRNLAARRPEGNRRLRSKGSGSTNGSGAQSS
jgi:ATP-dependent RNA helicase SUPV3L1/SUV3